MTDRAGEGSQEVQASPRGSGPSVSGRGEARIRSLEGGGERLPESERSFFEPRFGTDFSDVRVHTGPEADTAARSIDAEAFTTGSNIAFASGAYEPGSTAGRALLAHELTHVVQQRTGSTGSVGPVQRQQKGNEKPTKTGETTNATSATSTGGTTGAQGDVEAFSQQFDSTRDRIYSSLDRMDSMIAGDVTRRTTEFMTEINPALTELQITALTSMTDSGGNN